MAPLTTIIKTTNEGISFGEMVLFPPVEQTSKVQARRHVVMAQGFTKKFYVGFSPICTVKQHKHHFGINAEALPS